MAQITIDRTTIENVIETIYHYSPSTSKIDKVLSKHKIEATMPIGEALMKVGDAGLVEILEIENNNH